MNTQSQKPLKADKKTAERRAVRLTSCRKAVLETLMSCDIHPTVRELHQLTSRHSSGISLATVYNCLAYLQQAGMVNEHRLSSGPARYCVNFTPHMHLVDEKTGRIQDVRLKPGVKPEDVFDLPEGVQITSVNAYLRGSVPANASSES